MAFQGSCHCGAVKFSVDADLPKEAMSCNCSICRRKGMLMAFFPVAKFTLAQGEDALQTYQFNKHRLSHRFCKTCGILPFGEGVDPKGNRMAAINIRVLDGIELEKIPIQRYNGRAS